MTLVAILVQVASAFVLAVCAASLWGLFTGASELRRMLSAAATDYTKVLLKSPLAPGISVLAIARSLETSRDLIRRLLDLHYGNHELVLVLNGPSDAELAAWTRELRLVPTTRDASGTLSAKPVRGYYASLDPLKLVVVHAESGAYASAMNAAVNAARFPVLAVIDPNAEFDPECLLRLMRPLLDGWSSLVGVCGASPILGPGGLASRIGYLELLRRWMVRGAAFARWRTLVPFQGASVIFKKEAVIHAGGFRRGLREVSLQLQAEGGSIAFLPQAVSWIKSPARFTDLARLTRYEQSQLTAGCNALYTERFLRPAVETTALMLAMVGMALGWIDRPVAALAFVVSAGSGMVVSMAAIALRETADPGWASPADVMRLYCTAISENLGYRQVRNLWLVVDVFRPTRYSSGGRSVEQEVR